jgi:hypothetical protein
MPSPDQALTELDMVSTEPWIPARDRGRQAGCESHMRHAALGIMGYPNVNGSFPRGTIANPNLLPGDRVSFCAEVSPFFNYQGRHSRAPRQRTRGLTLMGPVLDPAALLIV